LGARRIYVVGEMLTTAGIFVATGFLSFKDLPTKAKGHNNKA